MSAPCHNGGACLDSFTPSACVELASQSVAADAAKCSEVNFTQEDAVDRASCQAVTTIRSANVPACRYGADYDLPVDSYGCSCNPGFTGVVCEVDVNECISNPCKHGGMCVESSMVKFNISANTYGPHGNESISDELAAAVASALAHNESGGLSYNTYICDCLGWDGFNCEVDIDECASMPCENGGVCLDSLSGYEERQVLHADRSLGTRLPEPFFTRLFEALTIPVGDFLCRCPAGWAGDKCHIDADECLSAPCYNGEACAESSTDPALAPNEYRCTCATGWASPNLGCTVNIDECASDPCQNGAECYDGLDEFACNCIDGFAGDVCDEDVDVCWYW